MPYTFNGESYRTEDEANQARQQYINDRQNQAFALYADAASVGFDETRFGRLLDSGYGLSQMSDAERNYISKSFLSSANASTAYTKSAVDQYLSSAGLPPSSMLDKYRTAYSKYAAGGGIAENYGSVTEAQWKKINELWQKDWEYGLTDTDYARKAAGLAPSSYDDMYEDTLLDQELKAKGLPPSKLLNGKLGETYNKWVSDSKDYASFNEAVARRYYENTGIGAKSRFESAADRIAGAVSGTPEYTYEQAYADTLADSKWANFRKEHGTAGMMDVPDLDDPAYVMTGKDSQGNKIEITDENGEPVRDTAKWEKDLDKALDNNAKIEADEFALTFEKSQAFFDEYGPLVRADMAAEKWFSDNDVKQIKPEEYLSVYTDYLSGYLYNEGQGFTLDMLYPGVELSEEDKVALQPYVEKANFILLNSGYDAAQEYFANGEYAKDVKDLTDSRIVASMRETYKDVPGYENKTDAEILHQYYKSVGESYMMSADEIAKLESGEISVDSYMRSKVKNPEDAQAFAEAQYNTYMKTLGLPTDKKGLQEAYNARAMAEEVLSTEADNFKYYDRSLLSMSDEEYEQYWADARNSSAETPNADYERPAYELDNVKANADAIRENVRRQDPTFYDGKHKYSAEQVKQLLANQDAAIVSNYVDAVSFTDDFANKTSDMDYVNKRFDGIASKWIQDLTVENTSELWEYATDEEKRKLVYLADEGLSEDKIKKGIVHYPSVTYGRELLHSWDAQHRIDKQAEAGHLYVDTGSTFGNVMLEFFTGANAKAYLFGGIAEGLLNLGADTYKMVRGKELLSSERLTYFSDVTANNAATIDEYSKVGSFVYQMIPSMVQSAAGMALATATGGASEAFTLAAMSSQAYSGAVDQALRNGASSGEAYLFGLMSGINEALFEKVSLDHFVSNASVFTQTMKAASKSAQKSTAVAFAKTLLKRMATQGLVEGSEELFTSIANNFADALVLGYNSSYNKAVEHFVAGGMSREEAEKQASADVVKAVMMDFVGGLVSGALMSFGGDMMMSSGGRVFMDTTGITQFMNQTVNLSQISVQDALTYASENLETDANGKYTADSARSVFEELVKKGADASVLLRVRTELFNETNSTPEATTPIETMISNQRNVDKGRMLKSAEKYVYNKQANKEYAGAKDGKSNVSREQLQKVVNAYVDELSNRVTRLDVAQIQSAMRATQAEFIENISTLAGFKESNARVGARALAAYRQSLPEDVQNAIAQNAEKYKNTFNSANMKGAQAGHYAVMAATIEYAVGNGDALTGLNTVFGGSANVAVEAVSNACLNSDGAAATRFIDRVLAGVGACTEKNGGHLFEGARNGVNPTAYIATQMALARSMPENSMSRSTYDHIMKYGASAEALDLLTAANIIETNGVDAEASRKIMGVLMTSDQMQEAADKYTKAVQRYNDKLKIAEAHRQADAQALESENARIAGQEETVRVLEAQLQETQGSDKGVVDALAKARNALAGYVTARDNLVAEQNKRQASTQADLNEARRAYDSAVREYQMAMFQHSAAYVRRLGAQMENMKAHGSITDTEFKRVTLEAMYGTADDLNSVEQRIISAEKTAAVALGRALGVDVECVKFDDAFFAKYNVENPDKTSRGCVIGGKVFLNTDVMTADVGSLTDQVLLHEIGHVLEQSADNYKKFSAFALEYFKKRDGLNRVNAWLAQLEQEGMSKDGARKELVAEFSRQVALGDARAISALCKSAPKMSMRIFQWLNNTKARMSKANSTQSRVVNDAQRAFAKGLKAVRSNQTVTNVTNVSEFAPNRTAMDNALRQMEARVNEQANAQQTTQATEQPSPVAEQQTTPTAHTQTEQTEAAETEQTVAETAETPVEEEVAESAEEPAVEEQTVEVVEEQEAEETPAKEEPTEDFADVVIEEDNGYLGYDVPTESVNIGIKGETLGEGEYYYDEQGNAYDENGNLVKAAQVDTRAPAPTVDINNTAEYNNNGGQTNGSESSSEQSAATDGSVQGISGRAVAESDQGYEGSRTAGQRDSGSFGESVLTSLSQKGIPHVRLNQTEDAQGFYDRIGEAKQNNPYGAFVTQHEVAEYSGMRLYLDETGTVGVAVTNDGNIVSVFKNPNGGPGKAVSSIILTAIQNGGTKLDNFNSVQLSTRYIQHGFVPVSRTAFVDEFAPSDWNYERDGRPDIVFWVHNGDSLETIAQKIGSYDNPDFNSLPMFDDYEQAEAYRDNLISQRAQRQTQQATQAQLPFELTSETREKIMRVVASMRTQNADADGRVPKRVNDTIAKIVKNQVTHDANYVDTPAVVLDAYAERFKAPEQETTQVASNDSVREYQRRLMQDNGQRRATRATGSSERTSTAFSEIQQGYSPRAQYYTEYDPQTQAVADTLDGMTDIEKRRVGEPRIIETDHGYAVARVFNMAGFRSGNPMTSMYGSDKQKNIAMIAPSSEFVNGDVGRAVPPQSCSAIVMPNTDAYAEARADARDAGASVYAYDPSDPTNFDRAIDRAANMQHAQYMPSMGYDEWLERYNAIPQGREPRTANRPMPSQTTGANKVSWTARTAAEAPITTEETYSQKMPTWLQNGTGTYTPISNERSLNRARGVIERAGSLKQAAADLHHDVAEGNGRATDLLARAELLYAEMQNDNTLSLVEQERIFGDLCMISSDAGRALQLVSELKNMTPEGHISYIEQVGRRMSERHQRRTGQQTDLSLTEEEKDAYRRATTKEERDAVDKEVSERWAEETSKLGILDRIRNWRYFAMLGNPRTHFRNMIGNTLMMPITRAKDSINTLYQLADVKRGKMSAEDRTTTFFTNVDESTKSYVAEQLKKALPIMQNVSTKYIEEATKAAQENGEISESKLKEIWRKLREDQASTHITQGNTGFGRFVNALSSFNTNALELEDALYLGLRFKSSMYQQIQARGLDVDSITDDQLNNMVNYAMQEALRATFRDASALADALNKLARTNKATELAMEAIVPFKKTPINIAKRSMEYSPLGLIQGTYKLISNNRAYQQKIDRINASNYTEETKQSELKKAEETYKKQRVEAIDRLAAGTTGSALYIMGIIAASLGWVSIGRKDDEGTQFENALGKNNYSLNIGDVSIDLSAFSPAAVPLLMGTATWNAFGGEHEEGEPIVSGIISALAESVDPITEMSMLSGIAEALSGSSYSNYSEGRNTRWFGTIAGNALESYVGQFVPTFVGQTARIADPYARSYSAGNDYWASKALGSEVGGAVKNLQNKIGLGWLSEPKVDLHGDAVRNYTNWGDFILNWANNRILPATIKVDKKNDIDDELVRLYGVVDSDKLFPTKPSRNIGSYKDPKTGKNVNLKLDNDREYMQYQQEVGQTTYDLLEDLMQSMAYQRMSDADKAAAAEKIIDQAKSATKKRWKAQMMADRN